jgi:hypothetical protein
MSRKRQDQLLNDTVSDALLTANRPMTTDNAALERGSHTGLDQ